MRDEPLEAHHRAGLQDGLRVVGVVLGAHNVADRAEGGLDHLPAGVVQKLYKPLAHAGLYHHLRYSTAQCIGGTYTAAFCWLHVELVVFSQLEGGRSSRKSLYLEAFKRNLK